MQKFLKPREGLIVRHPKVYGLLQKQGELVDWNGATGRYWRRRVKCGDAIVAKPPEEEVVPVVKPQTTSPKQKKKENNK